MKAIWKGTLTFGLVNVPMELVSAVRSTERVSFRQLHKKDLSPIRYDRVCKEENEVVPWDEIVKGYEYEDGKYVVLTTDEIKSLNLESSKTLDILSFSEAADIDPRFFETPYYLVPGGKAAQRGYALLREAMRETGMVGIGKFVMRGRQYLAAIRVIDEALVCELMRFADELVDSDELEFPGADDVRPQELKMAQQLVESLSEPFEPEKYKDEYQERLRELIAEKMKGKTITIREEEDSPEGTPVLDIMARLQESLARTNRRAAKEPARTEETAPPARRRKATTARKRKTA